MSVRVGYAPLVVVGMCIGVVLLTLTVTGSTAAAQPLLYKRSAQELLPTTAEAGYEEITAQAGGGSRASATFQTPGTPPPTMRVTIRVFKTESAAIASFDAACSGCGLRKVAAGWKYKLRVDPGADRNNTAVVVARCRNLRVDTTMTPSATNPHQVARPSLLVIDGVVVKARRLGMSPCEGKGTPPPATGTFYWSESYAEQIVISKVRIPYCNAYPDDSQCRLQSPLRVVAAQCRGLDERSGTFTYSRFTCDVAVGYGGRIRGRLAVWPTGSTKLRWQIL